MPITQMGELPSSQLHHPRLVGAMSTMQGELFSNFGPLPGSARRPPVRPRMALLMLLVGILISAALCAGAILEPAPPAAVPMIVLVCIGCPAFGAWEAPGALAAVRANRAGRDALARFRRGLDRLPETQHPLGL